MAIIGKKIENALDIMSTKDVEIIDEINKSSAELREIEIDEDYVFARDNLRSVITKGSNALAKMIELSDETEHPRMYEVMALMMKTINDSTKDLLDIQKKTKQLKNESLGGSSSAKTSETHNVNNNIFVGSTKELQEFFNTQEMKKLDK